jgi:hypothetical protein
MSVLGFVFLMGLVMTFAILVVLKLDGPGASRPWYLYSSVPSDRSVLTCACSRPTVFVPAYIFLFMAVFSFWPILVTSGDPGARLNALALVWYTTWATVFSFLHAYKLEGA